MGVLAPGKRQQAVAVEGLRLFGREGRGGLSREGAEGLVGRVPGRGWAFLAGMHDGTLGNGLNV